uniref:Tudor domain-containing protein n=1 Tax=Heterosigma akashiwo TaxID=2829 RepID=A0A6S9KAU9_HETAK|mmetsp:Transcript_1765/g.2579  ORF Transcript_1765/g.2579 Transcript_1765/m.2579 type:complete len:171 (+) Transcript_1765:104-616(+)
MVSEGKYDWGEENEIRSIWQVGNVVERDIDGEWYAAKIVSVIQDEFDEIIYDVEYVDDGNVEHGVPEDELRTGDHETLEQALAKADDEGNSDNQSKAGRPREAPRPLGGALFPTRGEEEEEKRRQAAPRVVVHGLAQDGEATAYIINGPENNVATGSGLRGIRWLKEGAR